MKELFRERHYTIVGYYQSVLEAEGIRTFVRNQDLVTMTTGFPIPDMFPALCVLNEGDYSRASEILRTLHSPSEMSPGDQPVSWIFPAGVVLIFGGFALGLMVSIIAQLILEDYISHWTLLQAAMGLCAAYITWDNARRWILQRKSR